MSLSRKSRPERRLLARQTAKDLRDRQRLALLEPGGTPARPIEVVTASLVEPKARAQPCIACGANVRVDDHTATTIDGHPLRLAHIACLTCGLTRVVYFAIHPDLAN